MTNEEIFKYATKALKNKENRFDRIFVSTFILWFIGYSLIFRVATLTGNGIMLAMTVVFVVISLIVYLILLNKYSNSHARMKREFIYNLVRKDERMRYGK